VDDDIVNSAWLVVVVAQMRAPSEAKTTIAACAEDEGRAYHQRCPAQEILAYLKTTTTELKSAGL
jgi:hypothetical protein